MRKQRDIVSIKQLLAVIISIQLMWCQLSGLDPEKAIDQYLVDQWGISEGIPSNMVLSITQTPDGYLWIATNKGLVRFDGMKFSIVSFDEKKRIDPLETVVPDTIYVDRQGTLWIGSAAGLTSYHHKTGRFKIFTIADGLTNDQIRYIKEDMNGNLWISFHSSYVNRFSNGKFTVFNDSHGLEGKKVNTIIEDRKGNLMFGTRENGIFTYKDDKFFKYSINGLENSQIIFMHEDRRGDLWIGTTQGLVRLTGKRVEKYTTRDGLYNDYITYIKEDSERNLWLGTAKGLNRLKRKKDGVAGFENLLTAFTIMYIFEDSEKSLWIGTLDSGIRRLKDSTFISYVPLETYQDQEEIFSSILEDREGDIWIGAVSGKLFRFRGSSLMESITPPGISGLGIPSIAEDTKGNLWLGTNGKGVFQKEMEPSAQEDTFIQFTTRQGLADNLVTSIFKDSQGNLWLCTFDGVSVCHYPDGVIKSFTARDGLSGKKAHNVYEDKTKNIWIAADKGITVLKDGKMAKQNIKYYLPGISITCIYEDPSVPAGEERIFWIATHGAGLKRLRLKDNAITSYTTDEGMTDNFIYQFFEDQQGNFWLMSNSGILRISKSELNRFARGESNRINCISYGLSDGLKSLEFSNSFSRNSALQAGNGELWFITIKGISIVNPDKILINKTPPPVVIEAIFFDYESIPLHQEQLVFKGINDFTFHFTAPTFLSPEKIKFKYQLVGFDRKWVFLSPGKERSAHYQDLGPGTYTFRVTACNAEGVWNQTGASITFALEPFFYQTLLFKIAVFLLLAGLLAAAVFIYKKRPFDKRKKYQAITLNPQFAEVCIKRLNYLVENEKIYLDENISLQSLAEKLNIQPYQLSQLLNEKMNQGFSDFINSYRIEEATKILTGPRGAEKKNTAVAFDVGFNSMTAFYKAFKKFTGMTPNQYKREIKKK